MGVAVAASQKKPEETFIVLSISEEDAPSALTPLAVAKLETSLQDQHYTIFHNGLTLLAGSSADYTLIRGLGYGSCVDPRYSPPCLMYFKQDLKERALHVEAMVRSLQIIPDNNVHHVPIDSLQPNEAELLNKSGLDMLLVLRSSE